MASLLARNVFSLTIRPPLIIATARPYCKNLYEPDYLESLKSKIPLYDTLNIQLRGYDYAILENYQKFIHNVARGADADVEECWATPAQNLQIQTYKPQSEIVQAQYKLSVYGRTVQITDVSPLQLSTLLRVLEATVPAGVTVQVQPHEDHHEEVRYVPDLELITLKQQLEDMGGPRKK